MSDFRFERLQPHHYKDLAAISQNAFNIKTSYEYYLNKNHTTPFGEPNIGYIAYDNLTNNPAAFYGVYSYPISYKGKLFSAVQSADTMTHKDYQGKGLFTKLAKMTFELAKNSGAEFVFGWPNDNSYPGFVRKLNWTHLDNIKNYEIRTTTLPLSKLAKVFIPFKFIYKFYSNFILSLYNTNEKSFENSCETTDEPFVSHSKDFFDYKSFSGCRLIKVKGVLIWINIDGFLYIGDIEKSNIPIEKIVKAIKQLSFFLGADKTIFGISPGSYWDLYLNEKIPFKKGAAFCYLKFSDNIPVEKMKYIQADLDTF